MLKSRFFTLASLVGLAACAGPEGIDSEEIPVEIYQDIVGGVADPGDPAVVAIGTANSAFCTGTLIGPQTVLTAAHCFTGAPANATGFRVYFGPSLANLTAAANVTQFFIHPQYDPQGTGSGLGRDAAVLRLAAPVPNVKPIRINPTPMTQADVRRVIRHVGYGNNVGGANPTGFGVKRQASFPIREVGTFEYESGSNTAQTCNGDSGGPGLLVTAGSSAERVVGIVSYGDQNCAVAGYDTRVDTVADYIVQTAAAWETLGSCATDGVCHEGCLPTADVDCVCVADGVCSPQCSDPSRDVDCKALGEACTTADQCIGRRCVNDPQHAELYCSQACTLDQDCPAAFSCTDSVCKHVQVATTPSTPAPTTPVPTTPVPTAPAPQTPAPIPAAPEVNTGGDIDAEVSGKNGTSASAGVEGSAGGQQVVAEGGRGAEGTGEGLAGDADLPTAVSGGCSAAGSASPLFLLAASALLTRRKRRQS